jgi:hypothetical protein
MAHAKEPHMRLVVFTSILLLACGGSTTESKSSGPSSSSPAESAKAPATTVSSAPLQGTVGGSPFDGAVALARYGTGSKNAEIQIFGKGRTCADYPGRYDGWLVLVSIRWEAGVSGAVGGLAEQNGEAVGTSATDLVSVAFQNNDDDAVHYDWAKSGRVEVVEASTTAGGHGRLRVRATAETGDTIEGEVPVEICALDAH